MVRFRGWGPGFRCHAGRAEAAELFDDCRDALRGDFLDDLLHGWIELRAGRPGQTSDRNSGFVDRSQHPPQNMRYHYRFMEATTTSMAVRE